jgi:hypothetical protein
VDTFTGAKGTPAALGRIVGSRDVQNTGLCPVGRRNVIFYELPGFNNVPPSDRIILEKIDDTIKTIKSSKYLIQSGDKANN